MDNKKELTVFAWQYDTDELIRKIMSKKYDTINLYFQHEFVINLDFLELIEFINYNKIKINAVTISNPSTHNYFIKNVDKNLISFELWKTFWINRTHFLLLHENKLYKKVCKNEYRYNFTQPFATFNARSKNFRIKLIDKLFEENLQSSGIITFHKIAGDDTSYTPTFYQGQKLTIDDNFSKFQSSYQFNETFLSSFLHIPTESSIDTFVLSEKTAKPILCKLPFLTLGSVGYHRELKKLGFKLYDEIFDYSFDQEDDIDKRIELIVGNIKFVVENKNNLNDLYEKVKDKLQYNRNHAFKILTDFNYVPKLIKKHYKTLETKNKISSEDYELIQIARYFKNYKTAKKNYIIRPSTMIYDLWDNFSMDQVETELQTHTPEKVIILGENEWQPWVTENFVNIVNKHNIEVVYTTGSPHSNYTDKLTQSFNIKNFEIQHWPTFHFIYAFQLLKEIKSNKNNLNFNYSFISLNNRGHVHRCALIDYLTKYRLINSNNVITWHNFMNENMNYDYKYFQHHSIKINDDFDTKLNSYLIPQQYFESFVDAVSECTAETIMISEKTVKPLFFKKPFIVLGAQGFHKYLTELGFELYDEIFDYSFDDEPDLEKRAELFVLELVKLNKFKTQTDRKKVYQQLSQKIERNYNNMLKVLSDEQFIPPQVKSLMLIINDIDDVPYMNKYREVLNTMRNTLQ